MSGVDQLQNAEEHVAQMQEEARRREAAARSRELAQAPVAATAGRPRRPVVASVAQVRTVGNMRVGELPDLHELAVSIRETGLLNPPLVRESGDAAAPYELLAGHRRLAAMALVDEVEGARDDWPFILVEGVSRREALTMQFAENFHQSKPEPVQFARAARAIMAEDPALTAADVSRLVGAPLSWTRKALKLLDLPASILERVEAGDLSFTSADLVRRAVAKGAVTAETAEALVEEHAEGKITGGALKLGVGYVPPKPENDDELSRQLDDSRWSADRDAAARRAESAEDRDWDPREDARFAGAAALPSARPGAAAGARVQESVSDEDLDGYLLGLVLARLAPDAAGVVAQDAAHDRAFALPPHARLTALRGLGAQLLAEDPAPPRALVGAAAA